MRVVGKDDVGKDPDIVLDCAHVTNMDIAVQANIVANLAMSLNVGQRADSDVMPDVGLFSYCYAMAGFKMVAEATAGIDDGSRADQ